MLSIKGHCSYLGFTGYNYHSRNFFRALSKFYPDLKIRNFTVCKNQKQYINKIDKQILSEQTLFTLNGERKDYSFLDNVEISNVDNSKINIILNPVNHYYFFDTYSGPKIAYVVWETTLFPELFFNKLLEFDQLWVPSQWQRNNVIRQGFQANKVFVVPEALDDDLLFFSCNDKTNETFNFLLCGRWEYRKSTKEIIQTFLNAFNKNENVNLILNVDNQFSDISTQEQLKRQGFNDNRLIIKSFLSRRDYLKLLKTSNVLVTCARGEGWNRPLHEALALGTPAIYSNYGPQLEFTMESPLKVDILKEYLASESNSANLPGLWCEPNFKHLENIMIDVYKNYQFYKTDAINRSKLIQESFKSENIAITANNILKQTLLQNNEILFVTGGDKGYFPIIEKLIKSVELFSKHKIAVYGINDLPVFQSKSCINKQLKTICTQDSDKWYFKQKICLQALKDFSNYSNFVWIDGDSIVNNNIDNVIDYFNDLESYPISDIHHLKEYYFFDINEKGERYNETFYNELLIKEFNIKRNSDILAHASFFIFNQSCNWFFREIINVYESLKSQNKDKIIICNDEGIDNLLRWKYNFTKFLPQSNFETEFNFEYINDFFIKDGPYDFGNKNGWTFIPKDKSKVIYFHGNKIPEKADQIINLIKEHEFNGHKFTVSENIVVDFRKINLSGSTISVANNYGWFAAIYHEIYNLNDYDKINEIKIKNNDIVVDIGANFGAFSRYAITQGAQKIFLFEPDPRFFTLLENNIRPYDEAYNCAISDTTEFCKLFLSDHIGGSTIIDSQNKDNVIDVQTFTLDYFFESGLFSYIDFLKVDAEGAEFKIFAGISDANLLKIKKISLEYHNCFWDNDDSKRNDFLEKFRRLGFNTYTLFLGDDNKLQMLYLWK